MSDISRNLIWLLISQLATWALSLVAVLVVPRYLGAEDFGSLSFAIAYIAFFTLAVGLGTSQLMPKEVARNPDHVGAYVYNAVVMKLVLIAVLSVVAIGGVVALGYPSQTVVLVAIGYAGMAAAVMSEVFVGALSGMQRMRRSAALSVVLVYVSMISGILVLANGGGVVGFATAFALAGLIPLVGNGLLIWPYVRHHLRLDRGVWVFLVRAGLPLMLLLVFNQIYGTIDIPILSLLTDETTVGWYALAYRWAGIPIFIAAAVAQSHFPQMSIHGKTNDPEFVPLVNRAIQIILGVSIPAAVGLAAIADDLLDQLYRPEFAGAVRPLQILALQIPITGLDTLLATALIASDRLRSYLWVAGGAAAVNPLLCVLLVRFAVDRYDNGAIGTAIATFATEVFVMTAALVLSAPGVMGPSMVWWTFRCTLAGVAIFPVAYLYSGDLALVFDILTGIVIYAVMSLLLRTVTPSMIREIRTQLLGAFRRDRASAAAE